MKVMIAVLAVLLLLGGMLALREHLARRRRLADRAHSRDQLAERRRRQNEIIRGTREKEARRSRWLRRFIGSGRQRKRLTHAPPDDEER